MKWMKAWTSGCAVVLLFSQLMAQSTTIIRPHEGERRVGGPYDLSPTASSHPKVGLVLSGGGARGIAHIGVLRALESNGIPIDFVAGNSMGAIVGGLYAAGYSVAELESLALTADWADLLSLTEETRRRELYLDQKQAHEQSFLLIRFDGLQPVIPSALSSGQRLTNFLTYLTLQAIYHPNPSFDGLKTPFRAVATDLISGERVVLDRGSLAEALRASITVPLLFVPLARGEMSLVDGGLISNIPVDLAKDYGCDVIISSNTASGMRPADQLRAPWETADQIMSIMMQGSNEKQLALADVVITPPLGDHLSSAFTGLDSLIRLGEEATERAIPSITSLIRSRTKRHRELHNVEIVVRGDSIPDEMFEELRMHSEQYSLTTDVLEEWLRNVMLTGRYRDVYAELVQDVAAGGERPERMNVVIHAVANPVLREVRFAGNTKVSTREIRDLFVPFLERPIRYREIAECIEDVVRLYRNLGHSLARVYSLKFSEETGELSFMIDEGIIFRIDVEGNERTKDYVIRREFPQDRGELFSIDAAQRGIVNINSTGLFESVLLEIRREADRPVVVLNVKEKPTNHLRLGINADNERGFQGLVDIRDASFLGTGSEVGATLAMGGRNQLYRAEYRAHRIFRTHLTISGRGYHHREDIYQYANAPQVKPSRWERLASGEYRTLRSGATLAFGAQLERFGNITTELRMEQQRLRPITVDGVSADGYRLASVKIGTVIDTKNRFPFPTSGMMMAGNYEAAMRKLGSEISFGKLTFVYEIYSTLHKRHTLRPRLTLGVADATLPLIEQFRLGGLDSFYGLRENDSRGRQLFLINFEYRYWLPFKFVFETYLRVRYDVGMISALPEEIRFAKFHHGVGSEIVLGTPIGPASFGMGRSFFVRRDLRDRPLSVGPMLMYFSIGYGF